MDIDIQLEVQNVKLKRQPLEHFSIFSF